MSGPRRRNKRFKPTISRRHFLRSLGAAGAVAGVAPFLPGCGGGLMPADGSTSGPGGSGSGADTPVEFRHGVASGDPLADRVILWTRVTPVTGAPASIPVGYVVATDQALTHIVASGTAQAVPATDYTIKLDPVGLSPATTYFYRFNVGTVLSSIGRTKTLPLVSTAVSRLKIAVVSCASLGHGYFNAYHRIAERTDLDLVVHLGDYIYEYSSGADGKEVYGTARTYDPPTEIITLSDYRRRHAQYKADPDLMALHLQHPMINVWDDHETADNSYKDGAVNHNETGTQEGDWHLRVGSALQAFYEWMPVRQVDANNQLKNYRRFSIGNLVDLIMLETRLIARDKQLDATLTAPGLPVGVFAQQGEFANPDRTLLGTEQEAWFIDQMRSSTAKWKLIGQQVMFGQLKVVGAPNALGASLYLNSDQWDGYDPARTRILNAIQGDGSHPAVNNVVVLTGDIHTSWAMDINPDPNNPLVYNPLNGTGSQAVEFVTTSVTSPGLEQLAQVQDVIRTQNPHIKYVDLASKGYLLLDITPQRVNGEFWYVDTIDAVSPNQNFGAAFAVADGQNRLTTSTQTSNT